MSKKDVLSFTQEHEELWKFIKFSFAGVSSTIVEFGVYFFLIYVPFRDLRADPYTFLQIFHYDGIGYMWAFLISTTIGYAIAFVINRKTTFHADANPTISIVLYILMVVFTIFVTTWLGIQLIDWFKGKGWEAIGDIAVKPFVALLATVWSYPLNRFVIHRKKKD